MWIRTQGNELVNVNRVCYLNVSNTHVCADFSNSEYSVIGVYETNERALEVLDEIQEAINLGYAPFRMPNMRTQERKVYVMPKE